MPELFINKPVVKLPKKRQSFLVEHPTFPPPAAQFATATHIKSPSSPPLAVAGTGRTQPQQGNHGNDYLASDYLYFDGLLGTQSDSDVMDLIKSCDPIE